MGKKSKQCRARTTKSATDRREAIQARRQHKDPHEDPRAHTDQLRESFLRLSADGQYKWSPQRLTALEGYDEWMKMFLRKDNYHAVSFATKEDYSFLKGLYRNAQEDPFFRAWALYLLAYMTRRNLEEGYASLYMQLAIKICNQAVCVGDTRIDALRQICLNSLHGWRDNCIVGTLTDGTQRSVAQYASDRCDWCGKLVQEFGVDFMACCGRCRLTHYCSSECQKKDWKEGRHQFVCRKKGQFEIGDTACRADPIEFNNATHLLAPISWDAKGKVVKWLVSDVLCKKPGIVLAQHLRRMRPIKWWNFQDHLNKLKVREAIKKKNTAG